MTAPVRGGTLDCAFGSAHLTDLAFVEAFETCLLQPEWFHHADHVRLAWLYLNAYEYATAEQRFCDGLVQLAAHFGAPQKFDRGLTVAWLRTLQKRMAVDAEPSFAAWLANHRELLEKTFLVEQLRKQPVG